MFFSLLRVLFILRFFLSWFAFVRFCLAAFFVSVRCRRCFCARVPAFMCKKVPVYAQRRGLFCARVRRSLLRAFLRKSAAVLAQGLRSLCAGSCVHALPFLRVRRDACSPVSRRQRCPAVPSLRVRAVAAVPWRGFPPAVLRPRAVSAGELLPAVRGCLCVLLLPSGKNAVA